MQRRRWGALTAACMLAQKYWSQYDPCILFVNDFIAPTDADTLAPAPPDLSARPTF